MSTHMQNGWLANVVAIDEGQCIRVQWRYGANTFQQRDETMPGLYRGSKQLQAIRVGRANLDGIAAQFNPPSAIATVCHLDQDGSLAIARHVIRTICSAQWFFLASSWLRICRTASHMKHDGA